MAGGRPQIQIDWKQFDALCAMQCTLAEIAASLEVSEDTIERAVRREQGMSFADYFRQKRKGGFVSLRRKQWELAMSGNATMLIWLGKQYLGQKDRHEQSGPDGGQIEISYGAGLSLEQLDREIAKLLPKGQGVAEILACEVLGSHTRHPQTITRSSDVYHAPEAVFGS